MSNSFSLPCPASSRSRLLWRLAGTIILAAGVCLAQSYSRLTPSPEPAKANGLEKWQIQYFHDKNDEEMALADIKFVSPTHGVAVGTLRVKGKTVRGVALVTSDGGKKWSETKLEEEPVSLFALNAANIWMVTDKGIWHTSEAGRDWKRLATLKGALQVAFVSETRGFAVGMQKMVWSTNDGGRKWDKVEAAQKADTNPKYTAYFAIAFATPKAGMIAGQSNPPRMVTSPEFPDWIAPESARWRLTPKLTILMETLDGGENWRTDTTSIFGAVTRLSLSPAGRGLALVEYQEAFAFPAEVHTMNFRSGGSESVFRRKNRAVTDVLLLPNGQTWLAAIEPPGSLQRSPVPGPLHLLVSDDLKLWRETEVDYRANGRRAILANSGPEHLWVATDTGMILKLAR